MANCGEEKELNLAIKTGDIGKVAAILREGKIGINDSIDKEVAYSGSTPLKCAARNGHKVLCKFLLENRANLNSRDDHGDTALSHAAYGGHSGVCHMLLEEGAYLNSRNEMGLMPICWALVNEHTETKALLENYARSKIEINLAIKMGVISKADAILREGRIGINDSIDKEVAYSGSTPLMCTARNGHKELCKFLLENGASLNSRDDHGDTPAGHAAYGGHNDVCQLLLEDGADLNTRNEKRCMPIYWATVNGHTETKALLEQHKKFGERKELKEAEKNSMLTQPNGRADVCQQGDVDDKLFYLTTKVKQHPQICKEQKPQETNVDLNNESKENKCIYIDFTSMD